jgi:hypothetical protein
VSDATTTRAYRPGAWFGIFGDHATVLLPPTEKDRVARLWEVVDEGAGFDEVLDALISGGLRELPGFVLISELDADTKVVIRGAARAHVVAGGEQVELEGSAATTWVEQTLSGVTSMVLDLDGGDGEARLAVENGLVRVGRVEAPPEVEQRATEPPEVEQRASASVVETPVPDHEPEPEPDTASTPAPAGDVEHDGHTRAGSWEPGQFQQPPGIPGQPPAPSVTARPVARLVISSGDTVDVDRAVIVGRAPEARRFPSHEQPRLVTVPSPAQEISSTHLEVRPGSGADHGTAVVTDLGSTNGTVLVQPGLPPEDLRPGIAVQLIPGAIIDLGDGVTIQVVDP